MAEAGHPVSEPLTTHQTLSLELTLSAQSLFDTSKSSAQAKQKEPKEAVIDIHKEHSASPPTKEINLSSVSVSEGPGQQKPSPSEHCVPAKVSSRPCSLTEMHTPSHQHKIAASNTPQAGRTVQSIKSAALPVHRSHSDASPLGKQVSPPHASDSQTCALACHRGDRSTQDAKSHSMLACKQPMQLQQCNLVTTVCRGANSGEGGAQQPQSRCVCSLSPKVAVKVDLNPKCDKVLCYGSYIHHANFEDTFAAYCHPQPIPAPSQLLPRLAGVEPGCDMQRMAALPSASDHLTLPRLISSVSETGLDAKHLLHCCNLSCSLMNSLPPGTGMQTPKHFIGEDCCSSPVGQARTGTRDMGTMTTHKELKDVGVQTGESESITPHVFPQICLAEDSRSKTSCSQTPNTDSDGGKKLVGGAPKSPVKEVKWDAEGMTWEVYGASVDPEELGLAIQRHLEMQIKETASHAVKLSRQNTNTSRQSGNTGCQKKRSRIMGSIPACCARTTTAID